MAIIPQVITSDRASGAQVIDGSLKFDQNVSGPNSLSKTFASSGNRKKITWSAWIRRGKVSSEANLFSVGNSSTDAAFRFNTDDTLQVRDGAGGELTTQAVFRDTGWYHIVVKIDTTQSTAADRFKLYVNGSETVYSATSYASENANIDWNNNVNHYIGRQVHNTSNLYDGAICQVYFIDGQALGPENFGFTDPLTNTWKPKKYSGEYKQSNPDAINDGTNWNSYFTGDYDSTHGWGTTYESANAFDGDLSSAAIGQVSATGLTWTPPGGIGADATTIRIYGQDDACPDDYLKINGINYGGLITQGFTAAYTVLKGSGAVGAGITQLESVYLRDNSAGNTHYRWIALEIDGVILVANQDDTTTGTNGFYLPMDNQDDFEEDKSGNGNNWTKNSFGGTSNDPDVLPDSPSGISYSTDSSSGITTTSQIKPTTWATLNPVSRFSALVPSDGNLVFTDDDSTNGGDQGIQATIMPTSGSYYWEVTPTALASENYYGVSKQHKLTQTVWTGGAVDAYFYYNNGKKIGGGNGNGGETYGSSFAVNDVIGVAASWDDGKITFYKNGVSQGVAFSSVDLTGYIPSVYLNTNQTGAGRINFGQKPFKYAVPDGYQPLCAANARPDKVISRPDQYVGVTTYTGDSNPIPLKTGFKPDLVWIKGLTSSTTTVVFDSVRGLANYLQLSETDQSYSGGITQTDQVGYLVPTGTASNNGSSNRYVTWTWKAGGDKNTFNIDNVGYSTAGDANMGVGDLTSNFYNTSQTWSSNIVTTGNGGNWHGSFPPAYAFNGNNSNYAHGNADGSVSATVTLTFNPAIPCKDNVTFLGGFTNTSAGTGTISINGGTTQAVTQCAAADPAATDITVVPFTGNVSTITINKTSGGAQGLILFGFKIDEALLIDSGTDISGFTQYPSIAPVGASVGTKQGFSIIQYQGNGSTDQTIPHGLTQRPDFSIFKNIDGASNWTIFHRSATTTTQKVFYLNTDGAVADYSGGDSTWWGALPNASVFTIGATSTAINNGTNDMISYHWHNVPGLQKFGGYTGNGDSDGPYVELGFKPALLWIKNIDTGGEVWCAHDSKRDPFNLAKRRLALNSTGQEDASNSGPRGKDLLSNGFKIRGGSGEHNTDGDEYIYCAWAEAPAIDQFGGGATAR